MADPDPENKINDCKSPGHGHVVSPGADPDREGVADQRQADEKSRGGAGKCNKPCSRRLLIKMAEDLVVQLARTDGADQNRRFSQTLRET